MQSWSLGMLRYMFHAFSGSVSQAEEIRRPVSLWVAQIIPGLIANTRDTQMESWVFVVLVLVGNPPRPLDLWETSFFWPTTSFYCGLFWVHHINLVLFIGSTQSLYKCVCRQSRLTEQCLVTIYNSNAIRCHRPIMRSSVVFGFLFPNGVTR